MNLVPTRQKGPARAPAFGTFAPMGRSDRVDVLARHMIFALRNLMLRCNIEESGSILRPAPWLNEIFGLYPSSPPARRAARWFDCLGDTSATSFATSLAKLRSTVWKA